jgi:capsule polysaccharide export protein KpsE/RkpR
MNIQQKFEPAMIEVEEEDEGPQVGLVDLMTWIGEGKRTIGGVTALAAAVALAVAFLLPVEFTARSTLLPPGSQQQSSSGAALAALGALGGLAGGLAAKTPDELYVALLKSDSVQRSLADRFDLRTRWEIKTYEQLRKAFPKFVRIASDKKSGLISVEIDDTDPKFAADFANAYPAEITKVLGRLAVGEAQLRRVFFEQQLKDTKENLVKAEQAFRTMQEKSGVIVLDKQAEAIIGGLASVRAQIMEREVQLKVLRGNATEQNPDVQRLSAELRALRAEAARMESGRGSANGSASPSDIAVGSIPGASIDYIRALRELKLQEALLESMIKQYEIAKLDEAKEGPALQVVDAALPPDRKSKPQRALIALGAAVAALLLSMAWVVSRRYAALSREQDPERAHAWEAMSRAWRWRRG